MASQVRQFTKSQVALNNGLNNSPLWLIVRNNVYDLTDYMDKHPGGVDLLLEYGGKDATRGFNDIGHSTDATKTMAKYKIGILVQEKCKNSENGNQSSAKRKTFKRLILTKLLCPNVS